MSQALLLIAHGSRRETANREIRELTARLRERVGARFIWTEHAFLELAEPDIPHGIQALIDRGARDIVILPYFLAAGNHVAKDIPALVGGKQAEHPDVSLRVMPYLGASDGLVELLALSACAAPAGV